MHTKHKSTIDGYMNVAFKTFVRNIFWGEAKPKKGETAVCGHSYREYIAPYWSCDGPTEKPTGTNNMR